MEERVPRQMITANQGKAGPTFPCPFLEKSHLMSFSI